MKKLLFALALLALAAPARALETPTPLTPDGTTLTQANGVLSCATATASQLGCARPDGTTVTVNGAGVLTATTGGGGTITNVIAGTGLTGGGTAGAVTLGLGTPVSPVNGGTGVNNGSSVLTLGGSLTTSGAYGTTLTATGPTALTLPTSGTLDTVASRTTALGTALPAAPGALLGGSGTAGAASAVAVGSGLSLTGGVLTATGTGGGTITSVVAGTGLTGGGTSGAVAVTLVNPVSPALGGSGVNNGSNTLTLAGPLVTTGAYGVTLTATGVTALTLPTGGTLATTSGVTSAVNSAVSTSLAAALPAGTTSQLYFGTGAAGVAAAGSLTGDCSLIGTALTCAKTNGASFGTAAIVNTGATGATVPLNNGGFTQSGTANFTGTFEINGNAIAFPGAPATLLATGALPAASGQLLGGSGSAGSASAVTVGSGLSLSGGTLTATGSGGTITSVTAGTGLTGGGSSGAVTLALSTPVAAAFGGTGVNNGSSVLTLGGSLTTSGAYATTLTATGATTLTLPTSGTLDTVASRTSALATALPAATGALLGGSGTAGAASAVTLGTNLSLSGGTLSNTYSYALPTASPTVLGGVKVDGSTITINGSGVISAAGGSASSVTVGTTGVGGTTSGYLLYANGTTLGGESFASLLSGSTGTTGATVPLNNGGFTQSGTANFTGTFEVNGYAMTFPGAASTLLATSAVPAASGQLLGGSGTAGAASAVTVGSGLSLTAGTLTATGGSGTITGVTAGTGLTGGGTSGAVTVALATPVAATNGGTGVNNGSNTLTLGGSLTTSGAYATTLTTTAATSVTLPTSGTLDTVSNRTSALATALPSGTTSQLYLGSGAAGAATAASLTGDCSLSGGAITCSKTNGVSFGTAATASTGTTGATVPLNNGGFTQSGTVNFTGAFQVGGYVMTFPGAASTLLATGAIPAASGQLLGGSGTAGSASAVTVGSGLSLSGGTLTATGGGGGTITGVTAGTGLTGGGTSGAVTVALASLSSNQVLGSLTAVAPSGLSVPSCSGVANALTWTSGTGFGCNTISGGSATSVTVGSTSVGSGTSNGLLYDSGGTLGNLATANSGVLVTSSGGVPSVSTTLPSGLTVPGYATSGANSNVTSLSGLTTPLSAAQGGTGVSNGSSTLTLGGSLTTAGAYATTLTVTAATAVTLPTSGTLDTVSSRTSALAAALPSGTTSQLYLGSGAAGAATAVSLTGDCSLAVGALTCSKTNGTAFGTAATANTGTTGATVPLNNGGFTQSGTANFTGAFQIGGYSMTFPGTTSTLLSTTAIPSASGELLGGSGTAGSASAVVVGSGLSLSAGTLTGSRVATGSVSNRLVAAAAADVFNVKDYGALGSGSAATIGTTYGSSLTAVAAYATAAGATPFSWMTNSAYGLTFSLSTSAAQGSAGTVLPFSTTLTGINGWTNVAPQFNGFWPANQQYLIRAGMTASGSCVPAGTTVVSTAAANNGAKLTSAAQGSAGTTLTFLETVGLVVGQPVTATGVPANTTISSLTATTVTLSASTTTAVAAQTVVQFGEIANVTLSQATSSACASGAAITFALSNAQVQALTVDFLGLQSAYAAAASAGGGVVELPAGNYEINRPVWNPGITNANAYTPAIPLRGAGIYTTQITPTTDFGAGACVLGESNRGPSSTGYAEFTDFRIFGPGTSNTVGSAVAGTDGLCVGAKARVTRVSVWAVNAGLNVLNDHQIILDSDFGNDSYGVYWAPNGATIGNQRIARTPTVGEAKAGFAVAWNNGINAATLSDSDLGGNSPYCIYEEAIPYGQTTYPTGFLSYSVVQNMLGENVGNAYIYSESGGVVTLNTFVGGQPVVQLSTSSSVRLSGVTPRAVVYVGQFLYNNLTNADFSDGTNNFALVSHGIFEGEFQYNNFGDQTVMMTNLSATVPAMITDVFGFSTGNSVQNSFFMGPASGEFRAVESNVTAGQVLTYGTNYNYSGAIPMLLGYQFQPLGVSLTAASANTLTPVIERGLAVVSKTAGTAISKGFGACVSSTTPSSVTACGAGTSLNQFTIGSAVIGAATGDSTVSLDVQLDAQSPIATASVPGVVAPDNSTITVSSGVLTATSAVSNAAIAAAGTTQGTATAITAPDVVVTSGSGTAYGVSLPAVTGVRYTVRNRSGVSISVYPPGTAQIESGGAGAPAILPSGADATYVSYVAGQWYS